MENTKTDLIFEDKKSKKNAEAMGTNKKANLGAAKPVKTKVVLRKNKK